MYTIYSRSRVDGLEFALVRLEMFGLLLKSQSF